MREILFRGKQVDNGEWVYGYYAIKGKDTELEEHFICVSTLSTSGRGYFHFTDIPVIPETIGEYTGLTDKNGKKIFVGDIVKEEYEVFVSARKKELRTHIGYIEMSDLVSGCYAYYWDDERKMRCNFSISRFICVCEIIGTIHDNPELIGGTDNA